MTKTLTLLILTDTVMASVACRPSAPPVPSLTIQELKELGLCEGALERRFLWNPLVKDGNMNGFLESDKDLNKYCKEEQPILEPTTE